MSDQPNDTNAPADPPPPPPAPPTLVELAQAVEDAEFEHAARLETSNASAKRAADDQKLESDAHQQLRLTRDALIQAASRVD
jgi:hypothetical protein